MTTPSKAVELRRCIGSAKFGIEPHEAPIEDFPKQPSQKDGLGRMCRTHWNAYTTALRKAALERKVAEEPDEAPVEPEAEPAAATEDVGDPAAEQPKAKRGPQRSEPAAEVEQESAAG
jgi:hypothetical protein